MKRRRLSLEGLTLEQREMMRSLDGENDLAAVLLSTSFLDACLAALLERFFVETKAAAKLLDPVSGALGTYAARADAAYCLGLLWKPHYQDIACMGEIRNLFAHHTRTLDFKSPEVAPICARLQTSRVILRRGSRLIGPWIEHVHDTPRQHFTITTIFVGSAALQALPTLPRCGPGAPPTYAEPLRVS